MKSRERLPVPSKPEGTAADRAEFDEATYLELYPDVAQAVAEGRHVDGWDHWKRLGQSEGRIGAIPKDFDELQYLDVNPDVLEAVLRGQCPSGLFHWAHFGKKEGRVSAPQESLPANWDEARYLRLNEDISRTVRDGAFASGYEHWSRLGRYEGRAGAGQCQTSTMPPNVLKGTPPGINFFAFDQTATGLGAAARGYRAALEQLWPVYAVDIPWDLTKIQERPAVRPPFAINLVHLNPDALPTFLRHYGPTVLPSRYTVGIWVWEMHAGYASWHGLSRLFNEIWTPSTYSAAAIRGVSAAPVHVVPHVVDCLPATHAVSRGEFGLTDNAFLFLYVFDLASGFDRKNPLALVRAFRKAFGERRDVQLLLKCHHDEAERPAFELLARVVSNSANIRLLKGTLPEDQIHGLLRCCDCFVSPHRSEGFGLNIANSMYYGKPVIATGYSGNMDFTTPTNSFLIDYDLVAIPRETGHYRAHYVWADPSEDHLAALLATVVASPEERSRRAELGRQTIQRHFSIAVVRARLGELLCSAGLQLPASNE
jgi:glycosyltransferase involved in cell wall biosynthesis